MVEKGEEKSKVRFGVEGSRAFKVPPVLFFLSFLFFFHESVHETKLKTQNCHIQLQNCHLFSNFVSFFLIFVQEVVETVKQNESKMTFLFRKKKAYAPTMQNSFTLSFQSQAMYGKFKM